MRLMCAICCDLFISHSHVLVTSCGHLYHDYCINEWLKRHLDCPQCRTKVKSKNPMRVYFNIEREDLDVDALQNRVDALLLQLQNKNSELNELKLKFETFDSKNALLCMKVQETERDLAKKNEEVWGLKNELKTMLKRVESVNKLQEENYALREKQERLQELEIVLNGTLQQVKQTLKDYPRTADSTRRLLTLVEALKEKNVDTRSKFVGLSNRYKALERSLNAAMLREKNLKEEITSLKKVLEEQGGTLGKAMSRVSANSSLVQSVPQTSVLHTSTPVRMTSDVLPVKNKVVDLRKAPRPSTSAFPSKSIQTSKPMLKSSNYKFDGMGGSKKVGLSTAMTRPEKAQLLMAAKRKTAKSSVNIVPARPNMLPLTQSTSSAAAAPPTLSLLGAEPMEFIELD